MLRSCVAVGMFFLFLPGVLYGQSAAVTPSLLTTHPLGMLVSRINPNFQETSLREPYFNLAFSSGNVWLPPVGGYIPGDPDIRQLLEGVIWYERKNIFNPRYMSGQNLSFSADGILRELRLSYIRPVSRTQQLSLGFRAYQLGSGKPPFSLMISDVFIEWFHTHITRDEDPFARKVYGFNRAGFHFVDEKGRQFVMNPGDFIFPGMELDYHYFPQWADRLAGIHLNAGLHLGFNTSRYNSSSDLGFSLAGTRIFVTGRTHSLKLSAGYSVLLPSLWGNSAAFRFSNAGVIKTISWEIAFRKAIGTKTNFSVGLYYLFQSPYRKREEYRSIVLYGPDISSHWHYALSHLYKSAENWSLVFGLEKEHYVVSVYLREDFKVNNAPDLQTGIQLSFPVSSASKIISPPGRGF
ncbi:MAG: hypothetical protein R3C61_04340 [Bacteroidia bacterium]